MKFDCTITETIQRDFSALWKCKQAGDTLEITTPYLLPDSTLLSVFLTKRGDRFIVCDGGQVNELLGAYCPLPEEEIEYSLEGIARKFAMKRGELASQPLFFKDCTDPKIISSLVFDVAHFATAATNALVAVAEDDLAGDPQDRFPTKAESFIRTVMKPTGWEFGPSREIVEVPGFQFGAVLTRASKLCLIAYVTGSTTTYFRRSVNDTAKSFEHAWNSSLSEHNFIHRTIPLVNTEAGGYKPEKLKWQLDDLRKDSHDSMVPWSDKNMLLELMR